MDTLHQDVRFALRTLAKSPGYTFVAVLCLALGIAANVTVFTPVNTLLLRPLPFEDPDRVVTLYTTQRREGRFEGSWSYPDFQDVGTGGGSFAATALVSEQHWNLGGLDEPERLLGARVSPSLFPLLGIDMALGRNFRPEEEEAGKVMLLSYGLWQRKFGADSTILGRALTVNGQPYTVVGVVRNGIKFPEFAELWLPLEPGVMTTRRDWRGYDFVARLAPNVDEAQARARVAGTMRQLEERYPDTNTGWTGWLEPFRENVARDVRPMMLILLAAVAFVLLIACANVANLMLARATGRQREIAVRLALGAGRGRVVRQLLTESMILALLGGALGALLGAWGVEAIVGLLPSEMPFWMTFDVDGRVLAATLALSVATGVVFGLAPALQASSPALGETLKESGRSSSGSVRTGRLRNALVVSELVLSVVLLIGASLMIRSFMRMRTARLGFEPAQVLTFQTSLQGARYATDTARVQFYRQLLDAISALPGVERAGGIGNLPVRSCCSWAYYNPEGKRYPRDDRPSAMYNVATSGYFEALRVPLLAGRTFDARDDIGTPRVAVINRAFADREWPGESALGQRFHLLDQDTIWTTVIGVVGNVVQEDRVTDAIPPQVYVPFAQSGWRTLAFTVRAHGEPTALFPVVREVIRQHDRDLPVAEAKSMPQVIRERMFEPRVYGLMLTLFSASALVLAVIGIYGVMAYAVAQRAHEFGVRMALGASPRDVMTLVLRGGVRLVILGLVVGIPMAFAAGRGVSGLLYGVSPSDPVTFIGIPLLLAAVALVASYVPARRATRVDPVVALRND